MSSDFKESGDGQCQFWQMAIETWKSSGLSVRKFCKQEGFSEPTFYSWRKRLGMIDAALQSDKSNTLVENSEADSKGVDDNSTQGGQQGFIEVKMQAEKQSDLELVLVSGNVLRRNVTAF